MYQYSGSRACGSLKVLVLFPVCLTNIGYKFLTESLNNKVIHSLFAQPEHLVYTKSEAHDKGFWR